MVSIPACQLCHHSETTGKTCCAHWSIPSHHTPKGHSHYCRQKWGSRLPERNLYLQVLSLPPCPLIASSHDILRIIQDFQLQGRSPGKQSCLSTIGLPASPKWSGCKPLGLAWGFPFQQIKDCGLWFQLCLSAPIQDSERGLPLLYG